MRINLIRAVLACGVLSGLTPGVSAQVNPVAIGQAAKFVVKAIAETATGLAVSDSYEALKQALAGPPAIKMQNPGEISVGLHAYDEYDMSRNRNTKARHTRRVIPNPTTGFLTYDYTAVTIDTNTLAEVSRTESHDPFDFHVRDLYDTCGSQFTATQRSRSITTRLAAKHKFTSQTTRSPAYFTFNLLLGHTRTGADGYCSETAKPVPDGTIWIPGWVPPGGYRIIEIPALIYPNILTHISIDRLSAFGSTTVSF